VRIKRTPAGDRPFFGLLNRLRTGQFYAAIEGTEFQKLQAPLCLTHHPKSPLTPEEVIDRARRGTTAG
jgi:hypothetical protein